MSNAHLFQELFDYNQHANEQFIKILTGLETPPEKAIGFMDHIFNAHQIWLNRVQVGGATFGVWQSHDPNSWNSLNEQLHQRTRTYLEVDPASRTLDSTIAYQNSKGQSFSNSLQDIYFHVINHSTHHRSQIALILRQHKIIPPASDYIFYKR
ncbi:MAG: hypothetical protein KTR30_00480 [Saprospiraceae bacterium]|nr:hypothetical protein [Saprospiraceae bacterium]